jgi:hypothetical protein
MGYPRQLFEYGSLKSNGFRSGLAGVIEDTVRLFQPIAHAAVWLAAGDVQKLELVESRGNSGEGRPVRTAVAEYSPVGGPGGAGQVGEVSQYSLVCPA